MNKQSVYIYVVVSLIAIGVLIGFLVHCEGKQHYTQPYVQPYPFSNVNCDPPPHDLEDDYKQHGVYIPYDNEPVIPPYHYIPYENNPEVPYSDALCNTPEDEICLCLGTSGKKCSNRNELRQSYQEGLTEYTDLYGMQLKNGGPQWKPLDWGITNHS